MAQNPDPAATEAVTVAPEEIARGFAAPRAHARPAGFPVAPGVLYRGPNPSYDHEVPAQADGGGAVPVAEANDSCLLHGELPWKRD